jgi:predicted dehydrogenase
VLKELVTNVECIALRSSKNQPSEEGIQSIYSWDDIPSDLTAVIITNPTAKHKETLDRAANLRIPIFMEKPVFHQIDDDTDALVSRIEGSGIPTYTACNFRFHPTIQRVKDEVTRRKPLEVTVYCGSYLPDWRPNVDYRNVYSAQQELGGGVHLDLIHEIDYVRFWFGPPQNTTSYFRKKSSLEINTPDIAHYTMEYPGWSVFTTLNYYRKNAKRAVEIVWEDDVWEVDLLTSNITNSLGEEVFRWDFDIMETYREQMRHFLEVCSGKPSVNTLGEGYETLGITLNQPVHVTG